MSSASAKYAVGPATVAACRRIWDDTRPAGLQDQKCLFKDFGFCILRNTVSASETALLRSEYERLSRDWKAIAEQYSSELSTSHDGFDLEPEQLQNRSVPAFRKIGRPCLISAPYRSLMLNERIVGFMREIMGPDICLFRDVIYPKAAHIAREKPWHHDQAYWPWGPPGTIVQTMTAIDPHKVEYACLQVIPQSHLENRIHAQEGEIRVSIDENSLANAVCIELDPGDTAPESLFWLLVPKTHRSPPLSIDNECF